MVTFSMFLAGLLVAVSLACFCAADETTTEQEIPFVIAPKGGSEDGQTDHLPPEPPVTDLHAPDNRGRSDIAIQQSGPFGGYFYPKPSKPFYLPPFKALDADSPTVGAAYEGGERLARSPQFRRPYVRPPPPFIPGFIPPHPIRPLPALYGRPGGF